MRNAPTFIAVLLTMVMAGCALRGKPKTAVPAAPVASRPPIPTPPPAPPALSIPQTQVDLPRPQVVEAAALSPDTPPPVEQVVEPPAPTRPPPTRGRPSSPAASAPPPLAAPEPAPVTPQIQEIVPAADAKRFQEQAQGRRRDVQQMLDQLGRRPLSTAQQAVITTIRSFLALSNEAEKRNDMKTADTLADRAQILARDLINGK